MGSNCRWYCIISFKLFMPKRLSWREILFTFGLIGYITWMIDANVTYTLDIFDMGKKNMVGLGDVITLGIIPSSLAVIYLNFFKQGKKWLYAVLFTAIHGANYHRY